MFDVLARGEDCSFGAAIRFGLLDKGGKLCVYGLEGCSFV